MKTKNVALTLMLAGFSLVTLNSCKKNAEQISTKENETVSVKNGMLNFRSQKDLNETISKLESMPLKDAENWIGKFGIKSLALDTLDGKLPAVNVTSPIFSRILNKDASVIVGSKIFLLKGNNEYLVNDQNFDLYNKILSTENYFQNDDKVYSKDVSANYKAIEIPVSLSKDKINMKSVNDGKVAVINGDEEVTTSGETTIVTGAFQGIRYHYSREFESTGRPERVYCAVTGQTTIINTSYNLIMKGEVFRKGGAFGGKSWREDAIAWGRIYAVNTNGNYTGPQNDTNFYYAFNLEYKTPLSIGWQYKKGYNDPTETFIHNILIQ